MKLKLAGAFCVPRYHIGGVLAMLWSNQVELTVSTYLWNHIDAWVKGRGAIVVFRLLISMEIQKPTNARNRGLY